jgi:hypothetical protein
MRLKIPCPLFMSWPDQHFHTQLFTADKLDPAVIKRCGEVTTSVALTIANAGVEEARYIANVVEAKNETRFMNVSNQAYTEMLDLLKETGPITKPNKETQEKIKNIVTHRKGELTYLSERGLENIETVKELTKDTTFHKEINLLKQKLMKKKKAEEEKINNFMTKLVGGV